jgi:hypothetical protein
MKPLLIVTMLICLAGAAGLPTTGLRFYYSFDPNTISFGTTVTDLSNHGCALTASGSGTIKSGPDRFSNPAGALLMDGTYHLSALLPDSTVHKMTDTNDFTFGIMFKTTEPSTSMAGRMDIAGLGDPYNSGIFLSMHDNRLRIFLGNHGYYDTRDSLSNGAWHSAIAVRSQGAVSLYIDGALDDQGAVSGSIYPISDSLMIGKHGIKDESYYKGLLDEVFYYSRAFPADTVNIIYRTLTGASISFAAPIDTFRVPQPRFAWHPAQSAIAYAFEIGSDSVFARPFLSVPLEDTAYTVPQALAAGTYFLRIGCNFDDRSPFVFMDWHKFVVK